MRARPGARCYTKWCPQPGPISRSDVDTAITRSLTRMGVPSLYLLQFHWWDYSLRGPMLDAIRHLDALRKEGKIAHLGLTNFDTARLSEFLALGVPIVSNQVQFSLVDTRPAARMATVCVAHDVQLLTYGTLCGGLLSDKFLRKPEPRREDNLTPSQGKYLRMIQAWGGWALFQKLLIACREVADAHAPASIANVAVAWVLAQPAVGGVIVGLRAGLSEHHEDNQRALSLVLTPGDLSRLAAVQKQGRDLMAVIGDCGDGECEGGGRCVGTAALHSAGSQGYMSGRSCTTLNPLLLLPFAEYRH